MAAEAQVRLTNVGKTFMTGRPPAPLHAVGPIDFDIRKGEFFAVVGPSGCGKSTLLELIAGLTPATEGTIEFEGTPIKGEAPDGIGVVFQEDASLAWLDVRGNVEFGLRRSSLSAAEKARRVTDALKLVGLSDFASAYPAQLSGGMRQRVCIARTLVMQPRLILLDEPFGALDQQTRLLMGDEVLRLWRETSATVFLITHALDEATMLADRIGVMSARPGRIIDVVETGWPRERDSRIVERPEFGGITARLWHTLREESLKTMKIVSKVGWYRTLVVGGLIALLEVLCLVGVIDKITMPAPHIIVRDLWRMMVTGRMNSAIAKTLSNTLLAFVLAMGIGIATAALLHRARALRDTLDPLFATYYAVPVFAFYPFFIVVFGLGDLPQVLIAFMLGVVAVIVNTLNGLDRVPSVLAKTARILRMSPTDTALRMTLPYASPYILTGIKLAVAYAFIGVIGSEFIMSRGGIGYEISFAYANFDNATMYPLILLILLASVAVNGALTVWEQRLLARRGMR